MSYQDLEAGYVPRRGDLLNGGNDPSLAVSSGVFQINTAVSSYTRISNQLGTAKDTPELRQRLQKTRQHISKLIKDTSEKLKAVSDKDRNRAVSADQKVKDAKLAKDFQTVLQLFEKAQKRSSELEAVYAPLSPQLLSESYTDAGVDDHRQALLFEQKRQEILQLDNEVTFNEAVIEERAEGIREIHEQIEEVNEIFKDLAAMVQQQGVVIEEVDTHMESTYNATSQANKQLVDASKNQKSSNSLSCLLMVIFVVALVIVIIVLAA